MTVGELKKLLEEAPDDALVLLSPYGCRFKPSNFLKKYSELRKWIMNGGVTLV